MIFGPLAAFELLAISEYVASRKVPILSLAAAEDMTQRKPNPYFVRASATAAQAMRPLGDYAAKELKYKTAITIVEDFAFGYEQMGGFQRVFDDAGGRVKAKLWPPIVTPDYTPYLAQLSGVDVIVQGFAGSNRPDRGLRGPAGVIATSRWLTGWVSDLRFDHHEVVAEDERVVVLLIMTGTHTGTIHGIAPTGKRFQQHQCHLFRMRAGQIVEHSALRDDLGMLQQLG